jgi:transposase
MVVNVPAVMPWSGPRTADLLKSEFHVNYQRNNTNRILREMEWEFRPPDIFPVDAP